MTSLRGIDYSHIPFHPNYIFCNFQNNFHFKSNICNHFGNFLNNQCLDYFNKNIYENCDSYINKNFNTEILNNKWFPFMNFITEHNKFYNALSDVIERFDIFNDNMDFINKHNTLSNSSYTLGITPFSDFTHDEYKKYISLNSYDLNNNICTEQTKENGSYQTSVDWRNKSAVTSVKDQGQCGSCWSFSTTGAIEGVYAIKNGKLLSFSEQQLVDCSYSYGNHGCNGGIMQNAFTYVHDKGITTESEYPYTASSTRSSCLSFNPVTYISGCVSVTPNSELQLTYAVNKNPVSVAIEADSKSFQLYKSGVYDDIVGCGTTLDHGVLTVGYGTENGKDYWLVKNSWSSSWGDNGYIKLLRNSKNSNTQGMCGIAMDASYPII